MLALHSSIKCRMMKRKWEEKFSFKNTMKKKIVRDTNVEVC